MVLHSRTLKRGGIGWLLSAFYFMGCVFGGDGVGGKNIPATYGPWHSCQIGGGGCVLGVVLCPSDPSRYYTYVDIGGKKYYMLPYDGSIWRIFGGNQLYADMSMGDWRHGGTIQGPVWWGNKKFYDGQCNISYIDGHVKSSYDISGDSIYVPSRSLATINQMQSIK